MQIKRIKQMRNLILATAAIFFIGCGEAEDIQPKDTNNPKIVKLLDLNKSLNLEDRYEYPAEIYSYQNTAMAFEVSGKIVKFNYNVGDRVKKGATIAKLDSTIYKANYNSALAKYKQAQLDYKRYKKLYERDSIAKVQLEKSKQELDVTKASYEISKKNLENTNLVAEFDGVVAKKFINDYERVTAKQKIILLQDNSRYKVKFFIPENDMIHTKHDINLDTISKQANISVTLNADEDIEYKAKLIDVSTTAEEVTRTYQATVVIENPKDKTVLPGMTAKVKASVKSEEKHRIYIPYKALFTDSSKKSYVWIVDKDSKVSKKEVKTAKVIKDSIEITSGLNKDDIVVVSGVNLLKDNDIVQEYHKVGN
jgi:RND family efflux transporter MFP subunit